MRKPATLLLSLLIAATAQQAPPPPQQGAQPASGDVIFKTTLNLVVEMVMVVDKDGKPIEGLTAKDFTITENNQPQTISLCEFQKLEAAAPSPRQPAQSGAPAAVPPAARAGQAQIAAEAPGDIRYRDRRLMALYFDMTAMQPPDQIRALTAARTFVQTQMTPADLMSIMKYEGGGVRVLTDFTGDRESLFRVIDTLVAGQGQGFNENAADDSSSDTGAAFGQDDSEFNLFNTDRQLAALQTAANMLGRLNEKKTLIYFASGMYLNGVDNQAQLRATLNTAIRANVSFWPIDARGLVATPPLGDATSSSPGNSAVYTGGAALAGMSGFQRSQDTLYTLAKDTGGKAMLDFNDLTQGMVQAQKAYASYYVLGYYTSNSARDGKFRRIKIGLKDLSARLDYRQGYYAGKEFSKFTSADKERRLEEALMLEDPITDLTIQTEVNYFRINGSEYYVPVVMKIPGSELALARHGGFERTVIDFIGEIKDVSGATIQNIRDKAEIKLSGETAELLAQRSIQYPTGYTLLPGKYTIKVLARENETGRIGTYISAFVVPNLNLEDKRIPISSVVLGSQRVDLHSAIYTASRDKDQVSNPLVQEGQMLMPSVTRVFNRNRDMYVYLQAYGSNATDTEPLFAFVTLYRGHDKAFETPPLRVTEVVNNRLKTAPLKFDLSLAKLTPGKYQFQVTVVDLGNQKVASWHSSVMLVE